MNKLHSLTVERGYSMRDLSIKIGFNNATSLRNVLVKRTLNGRVNQMGISKWSSLAKELGITLDECMKLYEEEATQ